MLVAAMIAAGSAVPLIAAAIALTGVLIGLWINGDRTERQRRRDLHARALAAVLGYAEMPFMIRRRRCEPAEQSAERVRLSDHFSAVKAELTTCQVLLGADGRPRLARAYDDLVEVARDTAGKEAHRAWKEPAIEADADMNMQALFDRLADMRFALERFQDDLARATRPRRTRLAMWSRQIISQGRSSK
jgi:hypothetical protein